MSSLWTHHHAYEPAHSSSLPRSARFGFIPFLLLVNKKFSFLRLGSFHFLLAYLADAVPFSLSLIFHPFSCLFHYYERIFCCCHHKLLLLWFLSRSYFLQTIFLCALWLFRSFPIFFLAFVLCTKWLAGTKMSIVKLGATIKVCKMFNLTVQQDQFNVGPSLLRTDTQENK